MHLSDTSLVFSKKIITLLLFIISWEKKLYKSFFTHSCALILYPVKSLILMTLCPPAVSNQINWMSSWVSSDLLWLCEYSARDGCINFTEALIKCAVHLLM